MPLAIKGVPPSRQIQIFRGKHDPVDVKFGTDVEKRVFSARPKWSKEGTQTGNVTLLNEDAARLGVDPRDLVRWSENVRQGARGLPAREPPVFEAPSLDEFVRSILLERLKK